jgi:hypothetical protein
MNNRTRFFATDKDRTAFFLGVTVLGSTAAAISAGYDRDLLTEISASSVILGLIGLLLVVVGLVGIVLVAIGSATPVINTAIQTITGQFNKFKDTGYNH